MGEREGPLTPDAKHQALMKLLRSSSHDLMELGAHGITLDDRDRAMFAVDLTHMDLNNPQMIEVMEWTLELQGRSRAVVRQDLVGQLQESFASEPCQEYIIYKWDDSIDMGIVPTIFAALEFLGNIPEYSGTLYNLTIAKEVERGLHYLATQENITVLKQMGMTGMLDIAMQYNISTPESEILGRWRSTLAESGGFV